MKALCFGEILWDVNGSERTLGGAPLNVAGHIRRLGGNSYMASAVGRDELGSLTLSAIDSLGVDRRLVHLSDNPTGIAEVTLSDGIPSYAFNDPAAWDDINMTEDDMSFLASQSFDAIVYGTLAARHSSSRMALFAILDSIDSREFFFDVNIRLSFYSDELIMEGLKRATILKMNDEEIPAVASALGCGKERVIERLFQMPRLGKVIVTCGKEGAYCYERNGFCVHADAGSAEVVSTVGAGDSLSAAFLFFSSLGYDASQSLERAAKVAEFVVTEPGAIPEYPENLKKKLGIC